MKTIDILNKILKCNNLTLWILEQKGEHIILHCLDKTIDLGYDKQKCIEKLKQEIYEYANNNFSKRDLIKQQLLLREALSFYSNGDNDNGEIARKALSGKYLGIIYR